MDFNELYEHTLTSISRFAREGNVVELREALEKPIVPLHRDNRGWTPLHHAAAANHHECLKLLLESEKFDIDCRAFEGETPLIIAIKNLKCEEAIKVLLENDADVGVRCEKGKTALHYAAESQNENVVKWLVRKGADVNEKSYSHQLPFHYLIDPSL